MTINSTQSQNLTKTGIIIIGSGFGGLAMVIQLKQANIHDFIILEKADQVGGTWRDNQYPGAACDVQSHLYSFSFAPKTDWSKRYADAPEIFNYINDLIDKFELEPISSLLMRCALLAMTKSINVGKPNFKMVSFSRVNLLF